MFGIIVQSMRAEGLQKLALHPTVKLVALIAHALRIAPVLALVLHPFCGRSSVPIAAEWTGQPSETRAWVSAILPVYGMQSYAASLSRAKSTV